MTFQPDKVEQFLEIFKASAEKIRNFPGCTYLELLRVKDNPNVFFTFSRWETEHSLEVYRNSPLFIKTWGETKQLFYEKANAWSLEEM